MIKNVWTKATFKGGSNNANTLNDIMIHQVSLNHLLFIIILVKILNSFTLAYITQTAGDNIKKNAHTREHTTTQD